ncbi:glycosyltransferase family 2 protein [Microbacterium hominis]|uniref:Glycosyltransferase family 2 protein n=1 Tax=Microbacterium hominis TaxID=162426 RepID=A0A7D4UJC9_9MICO|nr:glycosyltransferase family 2 protein [Microbacterium hominis]QKJ19407.1 glycosyltransferase family 2 protein [Microbacterium hominis]
MDVDLVLPCLDEAAALPTVLAGVPDGWRAIVVDNGSRDGSAEVARSCGAHVVHEPRRGYGAAAHAGLEAATAEFVVFADADASIDPGRLPALLPPLADGRADIVLGRRRPAARGAWPVHARIANGVLAARVRAATGAAVHDIPPVRAARRTGLLSLDLHDRRSGYPLETVLAAAAAGWRFAEVDIDYHPRIGRSKVTGTVAGTATAIADMSRMLRERRP